MDHDELIATEGPAASWLPRPIFLPAFQNQFFPHFFRMLGVEARASNMALSSSSHLHFPRAHPLVVFLGKGLSVVSIYFTLENAYILPSVVNGSFSESELLSPALWRHFIFSAALIWGYWGRGGGFWLHAQVACLCRQSALPLRLRTDFNFVFDALPCTVHSRSGCGLTFVGGAVDPLWFSFRTGVLFLLIQGHSH